MKLLSLNYLKRPTCYIFEKSVSKQKVYLNKHAFPSEARHNG